MNVAQLILELKKHNPDKMVLVSGYEEGYDELHKVHEIKVFHDPSDKHWKGEYSDFPLDQCLINAILLPR
jgi:hypothetical protein